MARSLGNVMGDSLKLSVGYARKLIAGVDSTNYARFAAPSGHVIESNHPAFIYGHLCLYAPRITEELGRSDLTLALPSGFEAVFSKDATCVDDPDGSIYPALDSIVETFHTAYDSALTAICEASDETLGQPNPTGGPATERFPTLGSMHAFYVGGHMMMHMGQLSAWRRMQGLGPA